MRYYVSKLVLTYQNVLENCIGEPRQSEETGLLEGKGFAVYENRNWAKFMHPEFSVSRETEFSFLKKTLRRMFVDNLGFALASLIYIAANILDYFFTIQGLETTTLTEGNPIIQVYMDQFGVKTGLIGYKLLICIAIIVGMKAVDLIYKQRRRRFRVEIILYGGAILTTFGGALWSLF